MKGSSNARKGNIAREEETGVAFFLLELMQTIDSRTGVVRHKVWVVSCFRLQKITFNNLISVGWKYLNMIFFKKTLEKNHILTSQTLCSISYSTQHICQSLAYVVHDRVVDYLLNTKGIATRVLSQASTRSTPVLVSSNLIINTS